MAKELKALAAPLFTSLPRHLVLNNMEQNDPLRHDREIPWPLVECWLIQDPCFEKRHQERLCKLGSLV